MISSKGYGKTGEILFACFTIFVSDIFLQIHFPHHPRHSFLRLDELIPVEPLVQLSERFASVALDMVLEHTFSSLGSTCTDEACIGLKNKN